MHNITKPLSSLDCYNLGVVAQKEGEYKLTLEWLQMALQSLENIINKADIIMEIAQTHFLVSNKFMFNFLPACLNTIIDLSAITFTIIIDRLGIILRQQESANLLFCISQV